MREEPQTLENLKIRDEISIEEKKILELMRIFNLSYSEFIFICHEGLLPALQALGNYRKPPWNKENIPEMDAYYEQLTAKYEALFEFFEEGKNELN